MTDTKKFIENNPRAHSVLNSNLVKSYNPMKNNTTSYFWKQEMGLDGQPSICLIYYNSFPEPKIYEIDTFSIQEEKGGIYPSNWSVKDCTLTEYFNQYEKKETSFLKFGDSIVLDKTRAPPESVFSFGHSLMKLFSTDFELSMTKLEKSFDVYPSVYKINAEFCTVSDHSYRCHPDYVK